MSKKIQYTFHMDHLETENAWNAAIDRVDYPVQIIPSFFPDAEGNMHRSEGMTNTGRYTEFNLVCVDRDKTGQMMPIASVTGVYGTLETKNVYESLKATMEAVGKEYDVQSVYITGNGGAHELTLNVSEFTNMNMLPNALTMQIVLNTSVDTSKNHSIRVRIKDERGYPIEIYGGTYTLKARHTTTIGERTIDFHPFVANMMESWNDTIIPMMVALNDCKFDRNLAIDMLQEIAEASKMSKSHIENVKVKFELSSRGEGQLSLYGINDALMKYIGENLEEDYKEMSDKLRASIAEQVYRKLKKNR